MTVEIKEGEHVLIDCLGQETWLTFDEFLALRWALSEHIDFIAHLFNNCDAEEILEAFDSIVEEGEEE